MQNYTFCDKTYKMKMVDLLYSGLSHCMSLTYYFIHIGKNIFLKWISYHRATLKAYILMLFDWSVLFYSFISNDEKITEF